MIERKAFIAKEFLKTIDENDIKIRSL